MTENVKKIYQFLREVGLTHAGAVGMLANMYAESKCDPLCVEALLIQRYKEEHFLKWDYGLYDENTYKQYWSYYDAGAISQDEFISPRQYTGASHQYGAGICQWTSHSRKKKWISIAKDSNAKLTDLGVQLNLLYWELKNTYSDVYRVLHSTINIQIATNYVLRNFEAPAHAASLLPTRLKYATDIDNYLKADTAKPAGGATVKKASDLDPDDWIVAVKAVAEYARVHNYTYGDSHATPPTADKKISCDRLVTRALWDRGFTDQPVSTTTTSGITVGSMDKYLVNHGFEKGTSFSDIRKGSIVVVGDTVPRHTFVTVSYDPNTKTFVKYDCGSQARINTKQPFTEKWAYQKLFAVYNIPQKKSQNGGGKVSAFSPDKVIQIAKNEVGYLEKKSNAQLDSKTGNAGQGNYTKYWRDLKPSFQGEAWCDCFVDWCFFKAYGKTDAQTLECGGFGEYYTPSSAQHYKDAGRYDKTPKIGDQIFFKNSSRICHTGIVYAVANGKVYTIEGNTSGGSDVIPNGGGVCMKSYATGNSRIAGYGHPRYNASATPTKPVSSIPTQTSNGTVSGYMFQPNDVKLGSTGNSVLLLQEILYARKLYTGGLTRTADGALVTAINAYQSQRRKQGIELGSNGKNDGICGKKMWADIVAL